MANPRQGQGQGQQLGGGPPSHPPPPEWDLLLSAAQKNDADKIRRLVKDEGVSPSHSNSVGQSAIHIASLWGNVDAVSTLIEMGADVSPRNRISGGTPLHCAVQSNKRPLRNRVECVRLLAEVGGADVTVADLFGTVPLDHVRHNVAHGQQGGVVGDDDDDDVAACWEEMGRILERGEPRSELHDLISSSAASSQDDVDLVRGVREYLAEHHAAGGKDEDGGASSGGEGGRSSVLDAPDSRGVTPLHLAATLLLDEIFREGAGTPPTPDGESGGTGDDEGEGGEGGDGGDGGGGKKDRGATTREERMQSLRIVMLLLLEAGADPDATTTSTALSKGGDDDGSGLSRGGGVAQNTATTVLHDCVVRICRHEADAAPFADGGGDDGLPPLLGCVPSPPPVVASSEGLDCLDVVRLLLVEGRADPNVPGADVDGTGNNTPLMAAVSAAAAAFSSSSSSSSSSGQNDDGGVSVRRCLAVANLLASNGGVLFSPDDAAASAASTALLCDAARRDNLPLLRFLLVDMPTSSSPSTASSITSLDVNSAGRQGLTPLHFAARSGRVKAARYLLKCGADLSSTDGRGKTPLDAARVNDKADVVALFEGWSASAASARSAPAPSSSSSSNEDEEMEVDVDEGG